MLGANEDWLKVQPTKSNMNFKFWRISRRRASICYTFKHLKILPADYIFIKPNQYLEIIYSLRDFGSIMFK